MITSTSTLRFVIHAMALALLCALLSGCSLLKATGIIKDKPAEPTVPSQTPYNLSISLNASTDLNSATTRQAAPVRVRIFIVEPEKNLLSQPFETIFEFDETRPAVAPSAIVVIAPGERKTLLIEGVKSQNQLVVAVAFQDVYSTNWIADKTIDTQNPSTNTVFIGASSVEIQ